MKVVILAGGFGTRISEESEFKPKPMVEIGSKPILWHIMKIYSSYGFNEFIICLGYKSHLIRDYFINYYNNQSDLTIDLKNQTMKIHKSESEPWKVTLVETGINTMTGGRLLRIKDYLDNKTFMLTYGDGVSNINILKLIEFHKKNKKLATLSAVTPTGKFGVLGINDDDVINNFEEKPVGGDGWINGGFFVLEPEIFNYIKGGDLVVWEKEPLENLTKASQLVAYKHTGFWKCMDAMRDKIDLEQLWKQENPPWKIW